MKSPAQQNFGVVILPTKKFKYPRGHPCHGCVYTFEIEKPSCSLGTSPDKCFMSKKGKEEIKDANI